MNEEKYTVMPTYCKKFSCIADKCRNSCCRAGWEIDIDKETLGRYRSVKGRFGEELKNNITVSEDGSECFKLGADGVCPFLNERGLCRLILEKGEEMLCDICREHPRFYNCLPYVEEMGIGLCCEEACRLIITSKEPLNLICESAGTADGEYGDVTDDDILLRDELYAGRNRIMSVLSERDIPITVRHGKIMELYGIPQDDRCLINNTESLLFARTLEPFDGTYIPMIDRMIADFDKIKNEYTGKFGTVLDNLSEYFFYRYYIKAYDMEYSPSAYVRFSLFSVEFIRLMLGSRYQSDRLDMQKIADIVCDYSNQIEYCEENVAALLEYFEDAVC